MNSFNGFVDIYICKPLHENKDLTALDNKTNFDMRRVELISSLSHVSFHLIGKRMANHYPYVTVTRIFCKVVSHQIFQ